MVGDLLQTLILRRLPQDDDDNVTLFAQNFKLG